ncbi:MAG: GNAT family N-acetyltransferase [Candidatus Thorarchaeota archaeon]
MVEIIQKNWEDLDIRTVAEITANIRRYEGLGDYTIDQVEEHLKNMNKRFPIEISFIALEEGKIVGWMGIERSTDNIGEVGRWQPFVMTDGNRREIGQQLISSVNEYAKSSNITRIEVAFGGVSEDNMAAFETRCIWYESRGWYNLEDTNFMVRSLDDLESDNIKIPGEFEFRPLLEFDNDAIFKCYFNTFTTGEARWIHDMSRTQIRQEFEKNFDRSHDINGTASFAILSDDIIVGFSLVLSRSDEEEHLEAIGIHPKFRRKGLGKILLRKSIEVLRSQNAQNFSLGVDTANSPAIKLYERFGFETVSRTVRYAWKSSGLHDD